MMNENIANFIGREGFNWWIGQVENDGRRHWNASLRLGLGGWDYSDWDWTNKVKVRIQKKNVELSFSNSLNKWYLQRFNICNNNNKKIVE